jgi:hypothetical protein
MPRTSVRSAAAALLVFLFTACGGGDPVEPPPTPTASITIGAATATLIAGATTPVSVTLTRGGGYAGAVTVTAAGLPTGVTSSTETIATGATTGTVTLTAAASAPAVTAAGTSITGSGTGVTIAPQALAVTVTPAASATIALAATSGSVQAGSNGTVAVTLTRVGGFAGDVVLAASALPAGVTVASQTLSGAATTATLTIVTTSAAVPATTSLSITGTATGVTIAPRAYALTITAPPSPIAQIGSDILGTEIRFGGTIALSADGARMVVGAPEAANGTTRVYQRIGTAWTQLGGDIVGEAAGDFAGSGVDINAAGTRIAIGASQNRSGGFSASGQVRVYDLVGTTWTQVGADIDGEGNSHEFGSRVALSASGNRLISGSPNAGRARVFDLVGGTWTQVGGTLVGVGVPGSFGSSVDVSSDGSTVAVGAASANGLSRAGTVQLYRLSGGVWAQLGGTITGSQIADNFGHSVSLSSSGTRVAIGAPGNTDGAAPGSNLPVGQVRVYELSGSTWAQLGASVNGNMTIVNNDRFGETLMLSDDGTRWASSAAASTTAQVYSLSGTAWVQTGPTITGTAGLSGRSEGLALSPDGKTIAVGYVNGSPRRVRVFSITP